MRLFFRTSLNEYQLVSNDVNYLFEQFNQIQQFLSNRFPSPFANLLAQPNRNGSELIWYSPVPGEIKPISLFSEYEQTKILIAYNARRHEIETVCKQLATSNDVDHRMWAEILENVFNPDHILLFSNGTDVVLVWGIKTFKKKDYNLPLALFKSSILLINPKVVAGDELPGENEDLPKAYPDEESSTNLEFEDFKDNGNVELQDDFEIVDGTKDAIGPVDDDFEDKKNQLNPANKEIHSKPKKKPWFYVFLDRVEAFTTKYWWLILLLLLVIVLLVIYRCDKKNNTSLLTEEEVDERYEEITPRISRKRTIPIDTSSFKEDKESGFTVIGGLLNVALVDNAEKFKRMAVELKDIFPDSNYKIVYIDEETHRLQFNFPEGNEEMVKTSIKNKLASFNPLVWNESVFMGAVKTNDPSLQDPKIAWYFNAINTGQAWDISMGDTSVRVAIIDDGFDLKHPEFFGKNIVEPYNVVSDDRTVYANDVIKHGTHVAGLALANANNNMGASGIAPKCSFMPIQIGDGHEFFTMTDVVDGILYALNHHADVINVSLGKSMGEQLRSKTPKELDYIIENYGKDEELFWKELFKLADKSNTMIVIAAGNENLPIGLDPMQRSDDVLKVVAVDAKLNKASFSNYCSRWSAKNTYISAPGVEIYSSVPNGKYSFLDGTSMASPIVAGAVALIKSVNPNLKNKDIMKLLRTTSKLTSDRSSPPVIQIDKALKNIN
ncbi:MAG: hypothetical protein EBV00_00330 [Burkholderiaceae bacterium]|nr:hypothetical protein [Burkholderiaceae bacterium]